MSNIEPEIKAEAARPKPASSRSSRRIPKPLCRLSPAWD
jgi:hypothetical protein